MASVACGVVGSFVVVRRTTYVAGAISHCVLGGMGAARYLQRVHGVEWLSPLLGATIAALIAALIIAAVSISGRHREDTVLSAIWAIGMAAGISFITATPGYYEDLMSYLFGNILMIGSSDLWQMALLDVVIVVLILLFYDKFLVISFQPELARLRGIRVALYPDPAAGHDLVNCGFADSGGGAGYGYRSVDSASGDSVDLCPSSVERHADCRRAVFPVYL